jgi:DNA-binding response OmpR family regulator
MDGFAVLQALRRRNVTAPVILLTARGQVEDRIKGLDYGADDYLAKPFHVEELLARMRALHRRKPELNADGMIAFGDIQFSPHTLTLQCGTSLTTLKLKESQILEFLIDNRNIVVSKKSIIEKVWGFATDADDNAVETHVSRLRKQLTQLGSDIAIHTIRGAGYAIATSGGGKHV